jgi:hypothetical protein
MNSLSGEPRYPMLSWPDLSGSGPSPSGPRRGPVMPLGVPEVLRRQMAAAVLPYTASTRSRSR